MIQRAFYSAFAAILLSAVLVQTAAAYPSTARSGTSTVTGTYRPLDLNLDTLVDGTNALNYTPSNGPFSFQVDLTGTFTGVDYTASGNAGTWRLFLSDTFDGGVTSSDNGTIITMTSSGLGLQVGTLTYLSGGDFPILGHPEDTPQSGDFFELFTTVAGTVLDVVCQDGTAACNDFDLTLIQNLALVGPYVDTCDGDGCYELDDGTINNRPLNRVNPLDGVMTALTASSDPSRIPEPATLALLGLGLAGLGLSRRARA